MPSNQGNTAGNINNWGLVTTQDNWIYYLGIYKSRFDDPEVTALNDEDEGAQGLYMNVVGGSLYYQGVSDGCIYKIRADVDYDEYLYDTLMGERSTSWEPPVKLNDFKCGSLIVVDDWIYCTQEGRDSYIWKMRTDGSNLQQLNNDSSSCINVVGEWIYYINLDAGSNPGRGHIYKMRTDGSDKQLLCDDDVVSLNAIGDWVYYGNSSEFNTLWKVSTSGVGRQNVFGSANETPLYGGGGMFYNIASDWVYFSAEDSDGILKLHKRRLDGSGEKVRLNNEFTFHINVIGDWVYYLTALKFPGAVHKVKTDGTGWLDLSGEGKEAKTPPSGYVPVEKAPASTARAAPAVNALVSVESLMDRASIFLEDGDWNKAYACFDSVLDAEPRRATAYIGKLCANLKLHSEEALTTYEGNYYKAADYEKAVRFADDGYAAKLKSYKQLHMDYFEKHGHTYLYYGSWDMSKKCFDIVLEIEPEYAAAYIGRLCASLQVKDESRIIELPPRGSSEIAVCDMPDFKQALIHADSDYRAKLEGYEREIRRRESEAMERKRIEDEKKRIADEKKRIEDEEKHQRRSKVERIAEIKAEIDLLENKEIPLSQEIKGYEDSLKFRERASYTLNTKKSVLQEQLREVSGFFKRTKSEGIRNELSAIRSEILASDEMINKIKDMLAQKSDELKPIVERKERLMQDKRQVEEQLQSL